MKVDIDALLELEAKATPSSWMVLHDGHGFDSSTIMDHNCGQLMRTTSYGLMRDDSLLVVMARNSIRDLCLELKAARKVVKCQERFELEGFNDDEIAMAHALDEYYEVCNAKSD